MATFNLIVLSGLSIRRFWGKREISSPLAPYEGLIFRLRIVIHTYKSLFNALQNIGKNTKNVAKNTKNLHTKTSN